MARLTYAANIPKFYLYKALRFPLLWMPVYVVFFQEGRGLSLAQIGVIDAVFWMTGALGEVPTGAVADRFGRKVSMLLGTALYTVSIALVAFGDAYSLTLLAFVGWGLALTLTSGADEALLYESLQADGRREAYTRVYARVELIHIFARSLGSIVGGLLAGVMLSLPFSMSALLGLLTCFVVLSMKEPPPAGDAPRQTYRQVMGESLRQIRSQAVVRWALVYLAVVPLGPFMISFVYVQPYALEVGLGVESLGVLVMLINLAGMAGVWLAPRLMTRFGEGPVLLAVPPLLLVGLVALSAGTAWPGLLVVAALSLAIALIRPVVMTMIHREVSDGVRATMVSLGSLLFTLLLALFSPLYGWLADAYGLGVVFAVMAATLALSMVGLPFLRGAGHRPRFAYNIRWRR